MSTPPDTLDTLAANLQEQWNQLDSDPHSPQREALAHEWAHILQSTALLPTRPLRRAINVSWTPGEFRLSLKRFRQIVAQAQSRAAR